MKLTMTPWLPRFVLGLFTFLMVMICSRFVIDPVANAHAQGLTVSSPLGVTEIRVAYGAFPAVFAIIGLFCLLSSAFVSGLSLVATLMGILLAVRFYSGLTGHEMAQYPFIVVAEAVFLGLSLLGLYVENKRRRTQ